MRRLRIVHWNVRHATTPGISSKRDHAEMMRALVECFDPQVIVLTEYVESEKRHKIVCDTLVPIGFERQNIHVSKHDRGTNGVLIATTFPSEVNPSPPTGPTPHSATNYLHVSILPPVSIELVGFRREIDPSYTEEMIKNYWNWFDTNVKSIPSSRVIAIGDFNLTPDDPADLKSRLGGEHFKTLFPDDDSKWQVATPSRPAPSGEVEWSHWGNIADKTSSTSRVDHALLSREFANPKARYVAVAFDPATSARLDATIALRRIANQYEFGGLVRKEGVTALSDHAVLVLDIESEDMP